MTRLLFCVWAGLFVPSVACAADEVVDFPFAKAEAVAVIDAKTNATATEFITPSLVREVKGMKLEVMTTHGWGWVERKQMMTRKEADKFCEQHKKDPYALYLHSIITQLDDEDGKEREKALTKALADLDSAVKIDPKFAPAFYGRANVYILRGDYEKAQADFLVAIKLAPNDLLAANDLAWFRATCPEAKYRNGKEAVTLATRACDATKHEYEDFLDTLAAAHAEAGDFKTALKWATKASELVPDNSDFIEHVKLLKAKKPIRDDGK